MTASMMKYREEDLRALAGLSDGALWSEVRRMAGEYGFRLGEETPPHEDLEKLRQMLNGEKKLRLSEAGKILAEYRERTKGGR